MSTSSIPSGRTLAAAGRLSAERTADEEDDSEEKSDDCVGLASIHPLTSLWLAWSYLLVGEIALYQF